MFRPSARDHFRHHRHSAAGGTNNGTGAPGRRQIWVWARCVLVGAALAALAALAVAAGVWHRQLSDQRLRRQAQALARQALERLNSCNNRTSGNNNATTTSTAETTGAEPKEMVVSEQVSSISINNDDGTLWTWWDHRNHTAPRAVTCESTLILVRHCCCGEGDLGGEEDPTRTGNGGPRRCRALGRARARYLASLFGNDDDDSDDDSKHRWPLPARLYALAPDTDPRPRATLAPLARKVANNNSNNNGGIPIRRPDAGAAELAADWLDALAATAARGSNAATTATHTSSPSPSPSLCGQVGVAAGERADLPALAHRLGCGPDQGCPVHWTTENEDDPLDLDLVWQLKYVQFAVDAEYDDAEHQKRRKHHRHHHHHHEEPKSQWHVYGTVTRQGFDPLSFRNHR